MSTSNQTTDEFLKAITAVDEPLVHAVTIRFHDDAAPEAMDKAIATAESLATIPGVHNWIVRESLDKRKGRRVLLLGTLDNGQVLAAYRLHPVHVAFVDILQHIADWDTVDFVAPPNLLGVPKQ